MSNINPGEAALAVIGISSIIRGEVPKIGAGKVAEMNDLDKVIAEMAKKLTAGTLPEPEMPRVHNYRKTLDRLSRPLPPAELRALADKFHDDGLGHMSEFLILLPQAYQKLRDIFPTADYQTFAGATQLVPDTEAVWRFFHQLQVINAPLSVFELIGAGAILKPQVEAVRLFFPSIAKAIDASIYKATVEAKAEKLSYRLPPRAEVGVAVWRNRRMVSPGPVKPKIVPTAKKAPSFKLSKTLATQGQQATNPGAL